MDSKRHGLEGPSLYSLLDVINGLFTAANRLALAAVTFQLGLLMSFYLVDRREYYEENKMHYRPTQQEIAVACKQNLEEKVASARVLLDAIIEEV